VVWRATSLVVSPVVGTGEAGPSPSANARLHVSGVWPRGAHLVFAFFLVAQDFEQGITHSFARLGGAVNASHCPCESWRAMDGAIVHRARCGQSIVDDPSG